jgi:glycosyltransferase involved in cell wall biosynthesis
VGLLRYWRYLKSIVHTPHGHIFYGYFSPFLTNVLVSIERFVTKCTSALITLTEKERQEYLDRNIGKPDAIFPILSGIDLEPFLRDDEKKTDIRKELHLTEYAFIAGTVARLVHVKNHDLIVSAASMIADSIPELMFVFVGDGDLHEHLQNRIIQLGLSKQFVFLGWRNDTVRLLKAFDFFIMCSHNEGMGRAFVEAQASGLPVIGSTAGGIPEVLRENITGYLVPDNAPEALASAITTIYNKRNERETIAKACREWVNPKFSKEVMVESIESLYFKFLQSAH